LTDTCTSLICPVILLPNERLTGGRQLNCKPPSAANRQVKLWSLYSIFGPSLNDYSFFSENETITCLGPPLNGVAQSRDTHVWVETIVPDSCTMAETYS
jgi:hypothetical protein